MKHSHHDGLKEIPAQGTRVLVRQTDSLDSEEVVGTMFGVVCALTDVSPLKLQSVRDQGHEPRFVVRWDRATWDTFDDDTLDVVSDKGGKCIEIDANEEYAKCPTPEVNARAQFAKIKAVFEAKEAEIVAREGGTHVFTEGLTLEHFQAKGLLEWAAAQFGMKAMFKTHGTDISGRVLRIAAEHYAAVVRKAN